MFGVEHHSDDIEGRFVTVTAVREGNFRSRHDQRNRNEKLIGLQAKIRGAQIQRQIGCGQLGCEFFLQLKFFIFFRRVPVIGRCIIAAPIVDFHTGDIGLYCNPAVSSVPRSVRAAITQQIIG